MSQQPITSHSATEMLQAMNEGTITSEALVEAHIERAASINPHINSIAQQCFEDALSKAKLADEQRASGEPCGALLGLPITVKENIATAGQPVSLGLPSREHRTASEDAVVVAQAKSEGAIVLAKTNTPQLLLSFECQNPLYGVTKNPFALDRSSGGSSGGEAAAIASGISPCGIGTDIGGSIRIPAAWCGIYGLKPTAGRWSKRGIASALPGQELVCATAGPMARCTTDLWLMMKALSATKQHQLDNTVPPLKLLTKVDLEGLRVGVVSAFPFFRPSAEIIEGIERAAKALERRGAIVVPFVPAHTRELITLYLRALSADGGETLRNMLGEDPPGDQLKTLLRLTRLPAQLRHVLSRGLELKGERRTSLVLRALGRKPVHELWALAAARNQAQQQEQRIWSETGLDLMLGPATVTVAAHLGTTGDWVLGAAHTMRSNLLNQPAGVVPVGRINDPPSVRGSSDHYDRKAAKFETDSAGLPIAVQITGRPWQENIVLSAMQAIEEDLGLSHLPTDPRERISSRQ